MNVGNRTRPDVRYLGPLEITLHAIRIAVDRRKHRFALHGIDAFRETEVGYEPVDGCPHLGPFEVQGSLIASRNRLLVTGGRVRLLMCDVEIPAGAPPRSWAGLRARLWKGMLAEIGVAVVSSGAVAPPLFHDCLPRHWKGAARVRSTAFGRCLVEFDVLVRLPLT
jgi:hypothetical protein